MKLYKLEFEFAENISKRLFIPADQDNIIAIKATENGTVVDTFTVKRPDGTTISESSYSLSGYKTFKLTETQDGLFGIYVNDVQKAQFLIDVDTKDTFDVECQGSSSGESIWSKDDTNQKVELKSSYQNYLVDTDYLQTGSFKCNNLTANNNISVAGTLSSDAVKCDELACDEATIGSVAIGNSGIVTQSPVMAWQMLATGKIYSALSVAAPVLSARTSIYVNGSELKPSSWSTVGVTTQTELTEGNKIYVINNYTTATTITVAPASIGDEIIVKLGGTQTSTITLAFGGYALLTNIESTITQEFISELPYFTVASGKKACLTFRNCGSGWTVVNGWREV